MKANLKDISLTEKLYKGFRSNGKVTAFLVCLLIAVICWVFTSLNKPYSGRFTFKLRYINIPYHKNITNDLPREISVEMEARGFDLIAYSFRQRLEIIQVDVTAFTAANIGSQNSLNVPSRNIITAEITGMQPDMTVKRVIPEMITFDFSPKYRKKVPVKVDLSVTYKKQYYAPVNRIIKPDSVEIAGSGENIGKITGVISEKIELSSLDHKVIMQVQIKNDYTGVEIFPGKIWVYIPVEELAEEEVEVPVELINSSDNNLVLLPDKVTIIYQAPLKIIDRINTEEFRVCADFGSNESSTATHSRLTICHKPPGIYMAKIEPAFVKCLTAR